MLCQYIKFSCDSIVTQSSALWLEASRNVRVAATLEPAAAVNLEYLVLALKDRTPAGTVHCTCCRYFQEADPNIVSHLAVRFL